MQISELFKTKSTHSAINCDCGVHFSVNYIEIRPLSVCFSRASRLLNHLQNMYIHRMINSLPEIPAGLTLFFNSKTGLLISRTLFPMTDVCETVHTNNHHRTLTMNSSLSLRGFHMRLRRGSSSGQRG